jgi:hypothetical protein
MGRVGGVEGVDGEGRWGRWGRWGRQMGESVRGHLHFCLAGYYNLSEALFSSARILSLL